MADKDWRVTLEFAGVSDGRLYDTTFCLREHTSVPEAENLSAATVASDVNSWLGTLARAMTTDAVALSRVVVNRGGVWGPGEGDPPEAGEASNGGAGTLGPNGTLLAPHGLCMRVTVRTALASRSGRGRFHAPWPQYAGHIVNADTWSVGSSYYVAVVAFADALLAGHDVTHDLISHHYSLRVHSRKDATTRDAVAVAPRAQVSYLRSRLTAP